VDPVFCNLHRIACLVGGLAVAGCSDFPELDEQFSTAARNEAFPQLVPVETLRAGERVPLIESGATESLEQRVAALRQRASRLRGTVINRSARARLEQEVTLPSEG
jgi:hypothetical protein